MRWLTRAAILLAAILIAAQSAWPRFPQVEPIEREHFTYYLQGTHHLTLADSVLEGTRIRLAKLLGDTLSYRPDVYIVEDEAWFGHLVGGGFPDWGAAAAIPLRQRMVLKSPDKFRLGKPLAQLLAHELGHLALAERCGYHRPPRWFDEGLCMYVSTEWSWANNLAMGRAAVFGSFVPLREIDKVNRFSEGRANVAYAQSYLAVQYLYNEYGAASVDAFLDAVAAGKSIDEAMMVAIGGAEAEFQAEFFESLHQQFNITSLFMDTMLFWLGLAVVVIVAFVMRYNKRRRLFKQWEEEEKYQSTDFDYGDPDRPEEPDDDEPWRS